MRTFNCEHCKHTFEAEPLGTVGDFFFAKCPECQVIAYLARPLLSKPISDWNGGDWIAAGVISLLTYKLLSR